MSKKKYSATKVLSGLVVGTLSSVMLASGAANAWGPERPTYTNENPAPKAVFNSITNNAAVGDERDFVRIVEVHDDGTKDNYVSELHVSAGKTYEVYVYYHNDASGTYNDKAHDYVGVARDSKISASFPATIRKGESAQVTATISSSTTAVPKVWDEATLIADTNVTFAYEANTAKIYNDWGVNGSTLSTDLFTEDGTYIGLNSLNGLILGCDEYSGQVVFRIKALTPEDDPTPPTPTPDPEPVPGFEIVKKASLDGENWYDEVSARPGDEVYYSVTYTNTGEVNQENIKIWDTLSDTSKIEYVLGSVSAYFFPVNQATGESGIQPITIGDEFFTNGLSFNALNPGAKLTVSYKVKLKEKENFECGESYFHNTATVNAKNVTETEVKTAADTTNIKVTRDDCTPPPVDCSTNPEMEECKTLPNTGPLEIVMAILIILGIGGGGYYLYRTRRTLKKVETTVKGEPTTENKETPAQEEPKADK